MLSLEQQTAFYDGAHDMEGRDMVKKARELLEATESHGQFYCDGGKFLPLSVWANMGYDVDRIERLTLKEDSREDRVLGKTFRVRVLSTGNKGESMLSRKSVLKRKRNAPLALDPTSRTGEPLALEDLPAGTTTPPARFPGGSSSSNKSSNDSSNESSDDSSNDSSSSSSKHKKKKGKKGKKGKKNKKDKKGKKNKKDKKNKKNKKEKKNKKDEHRGM
jgi:hypothetical protein